MNDHFKAFLTSEGSVRLVDTREPYDSSLFLGQINTTWKRLLTTGQRNYYSPDSYDFKPGVYLLTYADGSILITNPCAGDYIKPGYTRISRDLNMVFSGHDGKRIVTRSKFVPLDWSKNLVNGSFVPDGTTAFRNVYRGKPSISVVPGWSVSCDSSRLLIRLMVDHAGVRFRDNTPPDQELNTLLICQTLCKEIWAGTEEIKVRVQGNITGVTLAHRDGLVDVFERCENDPDMFTWRGDPIVNDSIISIALTSLEGQAVRSIEVVHDED